MNQAIWNPETLPQYEYSSDVIYIADSALNITYCNAAWDQFAIHNGGRHLRRAQQGGRNLVEVTPPPLRDFYASFYGRVLLEGEEAGFVYECSSAESLRHFRMHMARKVVDGSGSYLVMMSSLIREEPHPAADSVPPFECLRRENGLITMCSHCRRTWVPDRDDWVWIPDLVRAMPREVSHGLCPICFDVHYGM